MFAKRRSASTAKPAREVVLRSEADLQPFRHADPYCLPSDLHGNARWAWVQHWWRAGMFAGVSDWRGHAHGYPISALWVAAKADRASGFVHYPFEGHRLLVGAPGTGKFTAGIAPLLLDDDDANAFVVDPKGGEAFRWTARYRALMSGVGPHDAGVRFIDPYGMYPGIRSEAINPLDPIRPGNPNFVSDAQKLVDALVPVSGHEREAVWPESAKKTLSGIVLHVATYPSMVIRGRKPTLMDVQRAVSDGMNDEFLLEMARNPIADDLVRRSATEISALKAAETTWLGVKFQIDASLRFLDNPGVRRTLGETTFDLAELRNTRMSFYVVLPNKEKEALSRWLRLVYTSVIDQIDHLGGRDVHVVVDEFAALGKFDRVLTDLATQRAAGMRFHLAIQDLNQLNELYGHGWQTIVGNCGVRQFLGVNDNFTADYVSRALGQTTMLDGWDIQHDYPDAPPKKRARFIGRELMTPAEVLAMDRRWMIVFADRCARPLRLPKASYFDTRPWSDRAAEIPPSL